MNPTIVLHAPRLIARFAWIALVVAPTSIICGAESRMDSQPGTALVEFSGYLRMGGVTRFALTDPKQFIASPWLSMGQTFSGYTLEEFDSEREILSVRMSGKLFRLPLKNAKVKSSDPSRYELKEKQILIGGDGRLFISGEIIEVGDLRSRLEQFAMSHSDPKFKLTVYRQVDGDKTLIERSAKAISASIREMPPELRSRFPFVVLKSESQK